MRVNRTLSLASSFVFAATAMFAITTSAYGDASHPTRVTQALFALLFVQAAVFRRLWLSRELKLNLAFVGYELLSLAWTDYLKTATTTLPAILNSTLVLILFSGLGAFHNLRALLAGLLAGFMAAAALYTLTSGYPLTYPDGFSYNTVASMYLSGLFLTLIWGAYTARSILPLGMSVVLMALIAATTSIKTNLGIAIGVCGAGVLYFRLSIREVVKSLLILGVIGGALAYAIISNPDLTERMENGFARVSTGVGVLTSRESDTGSIGLETRQGWKREGLKGWAANPVFGNGVESFRAEFGITSHSTPIDLLYNSGLIGFSLFYSILGSLAWRLLRASERTLRPLRARITIFLIAYSFISASGIVYYDQFLYVFVGLTSGLLMRGELGAQRMPEAVTPPADRGLARAAGAQAS